MGWCYRGSYCHPRRKFQLDRIHSILGGWLKTRLSSRSRTGTVMGQQDWHFRTCSARRVPSCSFPTLPLFSLCGPSYSNSLYLTTSSKVSLDALALTFGVDDSTKHPFFFFPPDITLWHVTQSPTDSLIAISCDEGHVLFADVSAMMLS